MKQIIPFRKDVVFKSKVTDVTSISLEHTLDKARDNAITGDFLVSGEYKMTDVSVNNESFDFKIPFDISLDDRFDIENANVDIDDFYYEIINNEILRVSIDVAIDGLEELEEAREEEVMDNEFLESVETIDEIDAELDNIEVTVIEERNEKQLQPVMLEEQPVMKNISSISLEKETNSSTKDTKIETNQEQMKSIFDSFDDSTEVLRPYRVYIVREEDSLQTIMERYSIDLESLKEYNDVSEIKLGDKIIIPTITNE